MLNKKINSKKTQLLGEEMILIATVSIFIILVFYFSNMTLDNYQKQAEFSAPILPLQFQSIYIHTFLNLPLNKTTIKEFKNKGIVVNKVKDLLVVATPFAKTNYLLYQKYYIKNTTKVLSNFVSIKVKLKANKYLWNQNKENNLLYTNFLANPLNVPTLDSQISYGNFFYFLKNKENNLVVIYFFNPKYDEVSK